MKTILLLEDDRDIREIIVILLSRSEHRIEVSSSIQEFREKLVMHDYDLFILDIRLPDGNGEQLGQELRSKEDTKHIPVLLMSANFTKDLRPLEFIAKPFEIKDFINRVERLIA